MFCFAVFVVLLAGSLHWSEANARTLLIVQGKADPSGARKNHGNQEDQRQFFKRDTTASNEDRAKKLAQTLEKLSEEQNSVGERVPLDRFLRFRSINATTLKPRFYKVVPGLAERFEQVGEWLADAHAKETLAYRTLKRIFESQQAQIKAINQRQYLRDSGDLTIPDFYNSARKNAQEIALVEEEGEKIDENRNEDDADDSKKGSVLPTWAKSEIVT
ncbi:uncharacterized protein LOC111244766 [Varroa destructor]|uniref:RxLR effector protein n=1 Tax=Varroa destructor TaxID=109461 RepID=A0A7M7J7E8_VARDE|nr:uncharacterized protein LOC111244766 [Varroa destructor]